MNKQSDRDTIPDPLEAYVMENSSSSPALILEEMNKILQNTVT